MARYQTPAQYADTMVQESYSDDPDNRVDLDAWVDPRPTYRDVREWLMNSYATGAAAAFEINGYRVFAMVPAQTGGGYYIAAWHEAEGAAVSAWVRELPATSWAHGDYHAAPVLSADERRRAALLDALARAGCYPASRF